MLFEKILKIVFSGLKGEITYVQFHFDFLEQYLPATEPFPGTGFQITPEEISADDLPRNEQNRKLNPIGEHCRRLCSKRKPNFPREFHKNLTPNRPAKTESQQRPSVRPGIL
jgi:hypothetical protein